MWRIDSDKFLTTVEVCTILRELRRKAKRAKITRRNLILFNLAVCYGLRVSELTRLRLCDIRLGASPSLRVGPQIAKGGIGRVLPLTWDVEALEDIERWVAERRRDGATDNDLLMITRDGKQISRHCARISFMRICKRAIGRSLTIHAGRHTWVSHALMQRSSLAVMKAAGHSTLATTNIYAHAMLDDRPGSLFKTHIAQCPLETAQTV